MYQSFSMGIQDLMHFFSKTDIKRINLITPFFLNEEDLYFLSNTDFIAGIAILNLKGSTAQLKMKVKSPFYSPKKLSNLPYNLKPIIFLGPYQMVSKQVFLKALFRLRFKLYCIHEQTIVSYSIFQYVIHKLTEYLDRLKSYRDGKITKILFLRNDKNFFLKFLKKTYNRLVFLEKDIMFQPDSYLSHSDQIYSLLKKVVCKNYKNIPDYIPGTVILVNAGLAAGGAERQVVNTLIGLQSQPSIKAMLLCESLDSSMQLDFYLPHLEKYNIRVDTVKKSEKLDREIFYNIILEFASLLASLPVYLRKDILSLYLEFKARRPEIVHAWQDSTSIKTAIAALLAGVPKIIVSTRNVAPTNFAYYQPYMAIVYKALADLGKIKFINNSLAGSIDYSNWLGLSIDQFQVIRNGVDLSYLKPISSSISKIEKLKHGIPESARIIGSIFRFYPEKRPLLWVETAIKILEKDPNYYVVLAGDGPFKQDMQALVENANLSKRFIFMGVQTDISLILSLLDVFLLTSMYEGTPNVILEAQWMGVPVVAMNAGGTAEAMPDGVTGFVSDNPDPLWLANLVDNILSDSAFYNQAKLQGPKFIEKHFSLNSMIENTVELYGF